MTSRTKLNIALAAMIGTIILLILGVARRQANPGQAQADAIEVTARRKLVFTVEDLLSFAAKTPSGAFPAGLFPAELEARSGASGYFEEDIACWNAIQAGIKSGQPELIPYREPNQPEPLLVFIDFSEGERVTLKFVEDSLVGCQLNR